MGAAAILYLVKTGLSSVRGLKERALTICTLYGSGRSGYPLSDETGSPLFRSK
jgi:hypothetical protein